MICVASFVTIAISRSNQIAKNATQIIERYFAFRHIKTQFACQMCKRFSSSFFCETSFQMEAARCELGDTPN